MRIITWNVKGASKDSPVWEYLLGLGPDVALLQEVGGISDKIKDVFEIKSGKAVTKTGNPQRFSTAVLVKGTIVNDIPLSSEYDWVNRELEFFKGNFISCNVHPTGYEPINVISVYCPAWPVNKNRLNGIDVSPIKLKLNPEVWASEIIWSALKNIVSDNEWVVGGDYNSSETFDIEYQDKHGVKFGYRSSGNKEILERMNNLGFRECLRKYYPEPVPTYQNKGKGIKKVIHQMDHLFVTNNLYPRLKNCVTGDKDSIFGKGLSDHLPIIADFGDE